MLAINATLLEEYKLGWRDYITLDEGRAPTIYVAELRKIDLDGCPDDFREAFLKYIDAVDTLAEASRDASGIRPIKKFFLGEPPSKNVYLVLEEVKTSERQVQLSAQRHSVQVP